MNRNKNQVEKKQLRVFGLTVGGIFAVIAGWPVLLYGGDVRWWALALAVLLIAPALGWPETLRPLNKVWMKAGHVMGVFNTIVLLSLIFFVVVTPIGLIRRWLGRDGLGRDFRGDLRTYRVDRGPRPGSHLKRQY